MGRPPECSLPADERRDYTEQLCAYLMLKHEVAQLEPQAAANRRNICTAVGRDDVLCPFIAVVRRNGTVALQRISEEPTSVDTASPHLPGVGTLVEAPEVTISRFPSAGLSTTAIEDIEGTLL